MKARSITVWDSGWRGGGLCTPTQLCSGLRSTPYVKTFRMSHHSLLLMIRCFLLQHCLTKLQDVCPESCSGTAVTLMSLGVIRWWEIISRDVAAAANLRYLETVRNVCGDFSSSDGRSFETKRLPRSCFLFCLGKLRPKDTEDCFYFTFLKSEKFNLPSLLFGSIHVAEPS